MLRACCGAAQVLMREAGSDLNVIDLRYAGAEQVLAPSPPLPSPRPDVKKRQVEEMQAPGMRRVRKAAVA